MIAFNARFLIEMLSATDSDEVNMELSTPTKAGLLKPGEQDENEESADAGDAVDAESIKFLRNTYYKTIFSDGFFILYDEFYSRCFIQ